MNSYEELSAKMRLRQPQRDSLRILDRVCDLLEGRPGDPTAVLEQLSQEFPSVEAFEREFVSLCFALATGVGKTRLMGAFIAYLYARGVSKNFFVLAPNLTIYNKLIEDFTNAESEKYVFNGISAFDAAPPVVITGETYEDGRGARLTKDSELACNINIFNIAKINTEVRGGKSPRIKRPSEKLGESYFNYLAGLGDLVLLMDESHRYRGTAGAKAIEELHPLLGLELTATPQTERAVKTIPFKNVIYNYPLASALVDGYVKEPAVATRENFVAEDYTPEELERLKLADGVCSHEYTKVALETYARNSGKPAVKPFMLVVATDTTHADSLQQFLESAEFAEGRYAGKVIQVHSNLHGELKDEVVGQLLTVERADNPVEIVIHVNMLKEGWDVTNLYTIVPLRKADSRTLVVQSIGRGLRLPYGRRVGVPEVDRLTIIAHDKFQDIINQANDPNSIIRAGVVIGRDIPATKKKVQPVLSRFERAVSLETATPEVRAVVRAIEDFAVKGQRTDLQEEQSRQEIIERVCGVAGVAEADAATVLQDVLDKHLRLSIDVPQIRRRWACSESGLLSQPFTLDTSGINLRPVPQDILIQNLRNDVRTKLAVSDDTADEVPADVYLAQRLASYSDVDGDANAGIVADLASQAVTHLRSYLLDDRAVNNVVRSQHKALTDLIHSQMTPKCQVSGWGSNHWDVVAGYKLLRANNYTVAADESIREYHIAIPEGERSRISSMVFGGFKKCLYPAQKFDSDTERRFAALLEHDEAVLRWFKPASGDLRIEYGRGKYYEPDFVVETTEQLYLCEPKQANQIDTELVKAKAELAAEWCCHATRYTKEHGGKPWSYLLISHELVQDQATLAGLVAKCLIPSSR